MELAPMGAGKGGASGSQRERKTGRGMQPGNDTIPGEGVMTTNATQEVPGSVLGLLVASSARREARRERPTERQPFAQRGIPGVDSGERDGGARDHV